jgi:hypothetical protein
MLNLFCVKTKNLQKKYINQILSLKNKHWKHTIASQKKFFKDNINEEDLHIILLNKNKLTGYVCLRKKKYLTKNKIKKYLHFDTLIIEKYSRQMNYSNLLMNFTNKIIKNLSCFSILYCKKNLISFYKKYGWEIAKKKCDIIKSSNHKIKMIYNNNSARS